MMRLFVEGVGVLGPGLNGWPASRAALAGREPYIGAPIALPPSDLLPPAERRRTGVSVKLALAVGCEAFIHSGRDAGASASVFASSGADADTVHHICEALASAQRDVSPTRFHNSVHNAPSGYFSIASRSQEASTSVACYDASFAAGILETGAQVSAEGKPVALIAYDQPYPHPLAAARHIGAIFGVALVCAPQRTTRAFARIEMDLVASDGPPTTMSDAALEALRSGTPAARSLPLLRALARGEEGVVLIDFVAGNRLRLEVARC
jgi:hypothetical protein